MEDLVSVIIPFLNEEKYLKKSIESIISQSYTNLEILLIDDYSTDGSVDICKSFNDNRIRLYSKKDEPNGLANSRNLGIELARGKYVVFHDADDVSLPTRIEKQVNLIKQKGENTIAGTWVKKIIDGESREMNLPANHEEIIKGFERVRNRATIVAGIICFNKEIHKYHKYNGDLKYFEDWDFLLRLYESGDYKFYNVPEYLYNYLIKPSGTKYRSDWMDWNLVVRKNQERRKKGLEEFSGPSEMYSELKKTPLEYIKIQLLSSLINLKKRITFEFRKVSKAKE